MTEQNIKCVEPYTITGDNLRPQMDISLDTVWFITFLQELARKSENGIVPFSKATKEDFDNGIVYTDFQSVDESDEPSVFPVSKNYDVVEDGHIETKSKVKKIFSTYNHYEKQGISVYVTAHTKELEVAYNNDVFHISDGKITHAHGDF